LPVLLKTIFVGVVGNGPEREATLIVPFTVRFAVSQVIVWPGVWEVRVNEPL
jgi:hypothetical protein